MKKFLPVLFFLISLYGMPARESWQVTVYPETETAPVSELFWGTNFLFWIEDDAALEDGKIEKAMKDLPVRLLRYPGGTVADNFHWETNLLDNHFMFPYEEGEAESDFDEFMAFCKKTGAEPLLVVNTQSWALKNDIEGGAQEAAAWVRYCREKGYDVKYWEIGNETYWHPVMTAKEYGRLANVYAEAMKAADPDIVLSVNGGWDVNMTGNKERTPRKDLEYIAEKYGQISSVEDYKRLKEYADSVKATPWTVGEDKWWHDLITECGQNIDMISVHWYYHDNVIRHIDKKLLELQDYLKTLVPQKDYLLCLSEFNCNTPEFEYRVAGFAESVGRFLNAGTDLACFWPFRIGGNPTARSNRNMLSLESKDAQYPYQIFSLFQKKLTGSMIRCDCPDDLYAFASKDGDKMVLVVSGRRLDVPAEVTVRLAGAEEAELTGAEKYIPQPRTIGVEACGIPATVSGKRITFEIEPLSFVLIEMNLR